MSTTATVAPSSTIRRQVARPMPEPPPVTMPRCPSSSPIVSLPCRGGADRSDADHPRSGVACARAARTDHDEGPTAAAVGPLLAGAVPGGRRRATPPMANDAGSAGEPRGERRNRVRFWSGGGLDPARADAPVETEEIGGVVVPISRARERGAPPEVRDAGGLSPDPRDDLLPTLRRGAPAPPAPSLRPPPSWDADRRHEPISVPTERGAARRAGWWQRVLVAHRSAQALRRLSARGLVARKVRLALTALAVVLGVCFVSGTYVLTDTLKRSFDHVFAQTAIGVDVVVRTRAPFGTDTSSRVRMPAGIINIVRGVQGVGKAEGVVEGYAQFVERDGKTAINAGGAP